MKFQDMLKDINTREKTEDCSYTDIEELDFQILLTDNYYMNSNSIHLCFPMKIKKSSNQSFDTDGDMITVNNFFGNSLKEISITKYVWKQQRTNPNISSLWNLSVLWCYGETSSKKFTKKLEKKSFIVSKVCIITIHHWIEEFIMGVVYQCQLQMQQLKQL